MERFDLITEATARQIAAGSTVELAEGGHVTPLAQDTLRANRVTVLPAGSASPAIVDLALVADIRRIAIGSDHGGVALKAALAEHLRKSARQVTDLGTHDTEPVDYPDIASRVARAVARGEADAGIVIDGAGIGSAIAANKVKGIRAAMCLNQTLARYARQHNGTNVLALGATLVSVSEAIAIVDVWIATPMTEARYLRRLVKIRRLEESA